MLLFPEIMRQKLKDVPMREMFCRWCKHETKAAAWWTEDEGMLDWYCSDCLEPIETVVMRRDRKLIDYFQEIWKNEAIF